MCVLLIMLLASGSVRMLGASCIVVWHYLLFLHSFNNWNLIFTHCSNITSWCVLGETTSVAANGSLYTWRLSRLGLFSDPFSRGYPTATITDWLHTLKSIYYSYYDNVSEITHPNDVLPTDILWEYRIEFVVMEMYRVDIPNWDILQGCFELCNCMVVLAVFGSRINHFPLVYRSIFLANILQISKSENSIE